MFRLFLGQRYYTLYTSRTVGVCSLNNSSEGFDVVTYVSHIL